MVVVDDHFNLRTRIATILAHTCDVVGAAGDGTSGLSAIVALKPDVVVLDIMLPDINGLEVGRIIRQQDDRVRLVFYSAHDGEEFRHAVERLGRSALVLKGHLTELIAAVTG